MVMYLNQQTVSFTRWINKDTGATVLAFQFPEENLSYLRKLWQQPKAEPGNWLVKVGIGTINPSCKLITDFRFHERFRRPLHGSRPIILSEKEWNDKYSSSLCTDTESERS